MPTPWFQRLVCYHCLRLQNSVLNCIFSEVVVCDCWLAKAAVTEGLRHHFTLMTCNPEYTVADIKSDDVEWQTHSADICHAESECHLHINITLNTRKASTHSACAAQWHWFESPRVHHLLCSTFLPWASRYSAQPILARRSQRLI